MGHLSCKILPDNVVSGMGDSGVWEEVKLLTDRETMTTYSSL